MSFFNDAGLFLQTAVQMGTPLLFGTVGGILSEKVGNLNLGIEGMMLLGASFGFLTALQTANPVLALLAAGLAGALGALIYAVIAVTFRGNQTVTGLTLTIFGTGVSSFLGKRLSGQSLPVAVTGVLGSVELPLLGKIPVLGPALFRQSVCVYLSLAAALLAYVYFTRTRAGLSARVVGENPAAADASGVSISLYKYCHIVLGGFLCGLGGAYLSLVFVPRWQDEITAGSGWIAVALIIFSAWNPARAIFGAYLFGALRGIGLKLQNITLPFFGSGVTVPAQILDMIPYAMTILVLVVTTVHKNREKQAPAWLGLPYFRENR